MIYGRYRKLVRGIPQTRWPCRYCRGLGCERCRFTGKRYETSVEEIICTPLLEMTGGDEHRFHGLGREDVDVRMLGSGRPFVAEIIRPRRRRVDLDLFRERVNCDKVEISDLMPVDRTVVRALKDMRCDKRYRAVVEVDASPEEVENALKQMVGEIRQRTPRRVLHRRADRVRIRHLKKAQVRKEDHYIVEVVAESGLYIKELLHGDRGRTEPSLAGLLGKKVEVIELDVLDVLCDPLEIMGFRSASSTSP